MRESWLPVCTCVCSRGTRVCGRELREQSWVPVYMCVRGRGHLCTCVCSRGYPYVPTCVVMVPVCVYVGEGYRSRTTHGRSGSPLVQTSVREPHPGVIPRILGSQGTWVNEGRNPGFHDEGDQRHGVGSTRPDRLVPSQCSLRSHPTPPERISVVGRDRTDPEWK